MRLLISIRLFGLKLKEYISKFRKLKFFRRKKKITRGSEKLLFKNISFNLYCNEDTLIHMRKNVFLCWLENSLFCKLWYTFHSRCFFHKCCAPFDRAFYSLCNAKEKLSSSNIVFGNANSFHFVISHDAFHVVSFRFNGRADQHFISEIHYKPKIYAYMIIYLFQIKQTSECWTE